MRKLSLDETEKHFKLGIEKAREFFNLPSEVGIELLNESPEDMDSNADIRWTASVLRAVVRYDMRYLQEHSEKIWPAAGHEVAHLCSRELMALRDRHKESGKEFPKDFDADYVEGIEILTARLEQLFLRHCPCPGPLGLLGNLYAKD